MPDQTDIYSVLYYIVYYTHTRMHSVKDADAVVSILILLLLGSWWWWPMGFSSARIVLLFAKIDLMCLAGFFLTLSLSLSLYFSLLDAIWTVCIFSHVLRSLVFCLSLFGLFVHQCIKKERKTNTHRLPFSVPWTLALCIYSQILGPVLMALSFTIIN